MSSVPDNLPIQRQAKHNDTTSLDASASTSALSVAKSSGKPAQFFPFFALARELRDLIYDQPCLLEDQTIRDKRDRIYGSRDVRKNIEEGENQLKRPFLVVATRPLVNLKLASRQLALEYSERCEGRNKLFVRARSWDLYYKLWSDDIGLQLNVLHLHVGGFDLDDCDTAQQMQGVLRWPMSEITKLCRQLPSLRAVYVKLYIGDGYTIEDFHECRGDFGLDDLEECFPSLVSMDKLRQLKLIFCDDPEKCYDLSSRKHVLMDWKSEQLKVPTAIRGQASTIEYAESCCEGLSYDGPRVGAVVWDDYGGGYRGQIGEDRKIFMPIPVETMFDSGLFQRSYFHTPDLLRRCVLGFNPDEMRAAGLGSYLDGAQTRDDEHGVDVSSGEPGSNHALQVKDADMSGVDPADTAAEESHEADNSDAISHLSDNGMGRYYYGNMDGAMDDVDEYISNAEVVETDAPTPAAHLEAKESEVNPPKPFNFFGLAREIRDMIYVQPGMLEDRVLINDNFDGMLGDGNKLRVTSTKPLVSLNLVSKKFSSECIEACQDREKLFIRTSQFVHHNGDTDASLSDDFEHVRFLEFHLGDWSLWGIEDAATQFARRRVPYDPVAHSLRALADLETFQRWLTDLCSRMPRLRTVSLKMYVESMETIGEDVFLKWLRTMASLDKFEELKVVDIECSPLGNPLCWDLRAKHQLLLHWRAGDPTPPTMMDPTTEYAESCCEGLCHESRQWDEFSDYDYDGKYIGDDEDRLGTYY
jgi:hypothetical protein